MEADLKTKSAMCKHLGWSETFFDSVPLPRYHIGKRDYYKLTDVEAAIERTKKEPPKWESSKTTNRRITNSRSPSKVVDIVAQRALRKNRTPKLITTMNEERFV